MEGRTTCVPLFVRATKTDEQDSLGCGGEGWGGESNFRLPSGIYLGVQKQEVRGVGGEGQLQESTHVIPLNEYGQKRRESS